MTIEIRQLIIRASADASAELRGDLPGTSASTSGSEPRYAEAIAAALADERDALVAACVRQVLRELRKTRER